MRLMLEHITPPSTTRIAVQGAHSIFSYLVAGDWSWIAFICRQRRLFSEWTEINNHVRQERVCRLDAVLLNISLCLCRVLVLANSCPKNKKLYWGTVSQRKASVVFASHRQRVQALTRYGFMQY